jgi:uncharacterized protein YecE (DUF72 family)
MLPYLAKRMNAVEVDSSFYRVPSSSMIARWRDVVSADFRFTLKMVKTVTHAKRGPEPGEEFDLFCQRARDLGKRLGCILLQFPASLRAGEGMETMKQFLMRLPPDIRWAIELRHRSWMRPVFFDLLRTFRVALCMTDQMTLPRPVVVTADFTYIRWLGDRRQIGEGPFDRVQINRADDNAREVERLRLLADQVDRVYAFINNHWSGHSPADVMDMMSRLGTEFPSDGNTENRQRELF